MSANNTFYVILVQNIIFFWDIFFVTVKRVFFFKTGFSLWQASLFSRIGINLFERLFQIIICLVRKLHLSF